MKDKDSHKKKILVVDDDPDIVEAIQMILDAEGFYSDSTTKGEKTYRKVKDYRPDLIVLDVLLSGNDGREICKKLKRNTKTKKIPIVMISAHPTAKASVKDSGADGFVAKPFTIDELLTEIRKYLSSSKSRE